MTITPSHTGPALYANIHRPCEAMRFWTECVRGNRTNIERKGADYRVRFGTETHTAVFPDGSAVEWCRKTGEVVARAIARGAA